MNKMMIAAVAATLAMPQMGFAQGAIDCVDPANAALPQCTQGVPPGLENVTNLAPVLGPAALIGAVVLFGTGGGTGSTPQTNTDG